MRFGFSLKKSVTFLLRRPSKRNLFSVKLGIGLFLAFLVFSVCSLYVMNTVFHITTSNAVLYFVHGHSGLVEVKKDLFFEDSDRLLFMVDASWVFDTLLETSAVATGRSILETTWDAREGRGVIKEYRNDGSRFFITFSRFKDPEGVPQGLFIGGDLPYGDFKRDKSGNNSGISYFDGNRWYHIWCALNEGVSVKGMDRVFAPEHWKYVGSRILKSTAQEVIIESTHEIRLPDGRLRMVRTIAKKASADFVLLKVKFMNESNSPMILNYALGDEPWIGNFASSEGDIGWTEGRLIKYESFVSPITNRYAGFIDRGNDVIGESADYTGVANFIEWMNVPPSLVYFSNDFEDVDESRPLNSSDNRILNLSWIQQNIFPGGSRTYSLALGMAPVNEETGFPEKPIIY